ncbi:MAG: hypothetical protein J6M63_00260 [Pseudobutyrivibrio sp.]|uniref:hypothetical protein n=1 Tax=Pseudobutyrivibrio sp. TaxID=2014367 RepID=UPI001B28203A|nr:hypothetical protein [Pseudobutyrivibrio sp.]MBO5618023.1 hypothetical protein [Pseudobutyrivibrio sp.]MBO6282339.1 hypothetical protein [Pseudobutyrivibrio sp.]MBP3261771.1 hypothetical protein [Pseudobutyrivibrio sp.]
MKERFRTFKQLSAKQKLQYIWDYYKIHIIVTVVLICAIFSIVKTVKRAGAVDLYIAYVNVAVDNKVTDALSGSSGLIVSSYKDLLITENPSGENLEYAYASSMKLMSAISADKLDVIIGDSYAMSYANGAEYLVDIEDFVSANNPQLLDKLKPLFLLDDNGKAYAIDISGFAPFKSAGYSEPIYLGIVASDNHVDGKLTLLREFM